MSWVLANVFLFGVVALAGGLLFLVGFLMRAAGLEPDSYPLILLIGIIIALLVTYQIAKRAHRWLGRALLSGSRSRL